MPTLTPVRRSLRLRPASCVLAFSFGIVAASIAAAPLAECRFESVPRSRVVVLTDMGNEADDSQTMVRLLLYSDRFDLEGLIAISSCHQFAGKNDTDPLRNDVQPTMITERIRAYGQVRANFLLHSSGWPTAESLLARVGKGPAAYGMSDVGDGRTTDGSDLLGRALTSDDPRPLNVCINAGANCLAQALWDLRRRLAPAAFAAALAKLRIYDDAVRTMPARGSRGLFRNCPTCAASIRSSTS